MRAIHDSQLMMGYLENKAADQGANMRMRPAIFEHCSWDGTHLMNVAMGKWVTRSRRVRLVADYVIFLFRNFITLYQILRLTASDKIWYDCK